MMKRFAAICALLLAGLLAFSACSGEAPEIGPSSPQTGSEARFASEAQTPSTPDASGEALSTGDITGEPTAVSLTETQGETTNCPEPTPTPTPIPEPTMTEPTSYVSPGLPEPAFLCDQSFVYDVDKGAFLYLEGNDRTICPASTTKLLTILYARTLLKDDLKVVPGDELDLVGENSSLAYIRNDKGHILTVEQLIEGMLLPSGNDAAHVLAAAGGRAIDPTVKNGKEAVTVFMHGMNDYARTVLGLRGSNFITPDGYDTEGHFSTLEDMAVISREAYKDELIRKYAAMTSDKVIYASGHIMTWTNTNWCIDPYSPEYFVPEMNGMKTGAKGKGYYCFIGSAVINGRNFIFGFFGETVMANRFIDAKTAVNWIKENVIR